MEWHGPSRTQAGDKHRRSGEDAGRAHPGCKRAFIRGLAMLAATLSLAACVSNGTTTGANLGPSGAAGPTAGPGIASADVAGRWTLSSSAGGSCAMTFVAGAGGDGAVRPEGGCPGKFFTSRKWSLEGGAMVIRNHNNEPLARLTAVSPSRYEGQLSSGQQLSLVR